MIAPQEVAVGQAVTLEGYADDYGRPIAAVLFSWDDGRTWERYDVSKAATECSVHWSYRFAPTEPGEYCLRVRSESTDGRRSPEAAIARIFVREP